MVTRRRWRRIDAVRSRGRRNVRTRAAYLKSELEHYGTTGARHPGAWRRRCAGAIPNWATTTSSRWSSDLGGAGARAAHGRRSSCSTSTPNGCGPDDMVLLERLLRESRTWALVDGLAASVVGGAGRALSRLRPRCSTGGRPTRTSGSGGRRCWRCSIALRRGDGDFERFSRYADAMLDEKEFFIRKAIGWVLRDTGEEATGHGLRMVAAACAAGVGRDTCAKP